MNYKSFKMKMNIYSKAEDHHLLLKIQKDNCKDYSMKISGSRDSYNKNETQIRIEIKSLINLTSISKIYSLYKFKKYVSELNCEIIGSKR